MSNDITPLFMAALLLLPLCGLNAQAQNVSSAMTPIEHSTRLQGMVNNAAQEALTKFAKSGFTDKNLAITLVDLRDPHHPQQASYRGDIPIYPASVVKLFYLAAAHRWMQDGKMQDTPELRRAMRYMIVDSSNDATHYILDVLTQTTSGPELSAAAMQEWVEKRNVVNRYFAGLGYKSLNVNQKPWGDGPYGRERVFVGTNYENRNKLTTDATARLLANIATGHEVSSVRSTQMMELLKRDPFSKANDPDDQDHGFTGLALLQPPITGARLWSKAGWTSTTRHDAAYIELPNGARFVIVTFTTEHSLEREIIPTVVRSIIAGFKALQ